jgi:hypothetical protein
VIWLKHTPEASRRALSANGSARVDVECRTGRRYAASDVAPGSHDPVTYHFEPEDMPPQAFDRDYRKSHEIDVPNVKVVKIGISPPPLPEVDYSFLSATTGPCVPKIGVGIPAEHRAACKRMTEQGRYRGTWYVSSKTSLFAPNGHERCVETKGRTNCAELVGGTYLPWPHKGHCPSSWDVEFIGRRNVLPGGNPAYRIVVDQIIHFSRLPDARTNPASATGLPVGVQYRSQSEIFPCPY